jgi:general stress protein YciG
MKKQISDYLAAIGRKGGKKRAAKYSHATLSRWARKGGRPSKKGTR